MIQRAKRLEPVRMLLCDTWQDPPCPSHLVIPTQLTYRFSGPSTLSLTSHSLEAFEGPHTIAEPSLEAERRRGTC